jgi:ABC-type multidrug transport system ATPase subunit
MKISLSDAGKRFNREWIFRKFSYVFESNNAYAIVGPNGSGKSTLLQVIGGAIMPSLGKIEYSVSGKNHSPDDIFRNISISAPYLELIEEMTATEFLSFHQTFKPFKKGFVIPSVIKLVGLERAANKQIRYYSSGMKQRVKLAQAIFSDTPCLLLDEPCTNLDAEGVALYQRLVNEHSNDRLVIVSSNDEQEYGFCNERINVLEWK